MPAIAATSADSQRLRRLLGMGVRPWVLRELPARAKTPACVVIVSATVLADGQQREWIERALACLGLPDSALMFTSVRDGRLTAGLTSAQAYLVLGKAQAQALGADLSAEQRERACIVLVDEPAQLRSTAASKRELWAALKTLRRAIHASRVAEI